MGSVLVDRAVRLVNPATPVGQIQLSVPPASIMSASPYWMARRASPIQLVPVAQAVTTLVHFPLNPSWMEIFPAAMLEIISGTIRGLTLEGPLDRIFSYSRSTSCRLPMPEPTITPARKGSSLLISSPESS